MSGTFYNLLRRDRSRLFSFQQLTKGPGVQELWVKDCVHGAELAELKDLTHQPICQPPFLVYVKLLIRFLL